MSKYTVLDLFAGAGGLSYGFAHDDKFRILAANEIEFDMAKTYSLNHPEVKIYNCDIKEFGIENLNKDFGIEGVILRLTGIRGYGELLGHLRSDGKYKKSAFEIFVEKAINGEDIEVWGDVSIKRDHLYIKDLLSLFESIINTDGKAGIYNAASGIGYSLLEEAENIASVFQVNQKSKVFVNPNKQGLKKGYVYDIQETKEAFNWEPKYDNLKMLQDYKKEMEKKKFNHYHYIIESDRPATL